MENEIKPSCYCCNEKIVLTKRNKIIHGYSEQK